MNAKMKNISRSEVLTLKEQISYCTGTTYLRNTG